MSVVILVVTIFLSDGSADVESFVAPTLKACKAAVPVVRERLMAKHADLWDVQASCVVHKRQGHA